MIFLTVFYDALNFWKNRSSLTNSFLSVIRFLTGESLKSMNEKSEVRHTNREYNPSPKCITKVPIITLMITWQKDWFQFFNLRFRIDLIVTLKYM